MNSQRMSRAAVALLWLLTITAAQAKAAEPTKSQIQYAKNFAFGKVGFGTSVDKLLKTYPNAEISEKDYKGRKGVAYSISPETADRVEFWFVENKLFSITLKYTRDKVESLGGNEGLLKRLNDRFGQFGSVSEATWGESNGKTSTHYTWGMAAAKRLIEFDAFARNAGSQFAVYNTEIIVETDKAETKSREEKESKDAGF